MMPGAKTHLWCDDDLMFHLFHGRMKIGAYTHEVIIPYGLEVGFPYFIPVLRGDDDLGKTQLVMGSDFAEQCCIKTGFANVCFQFIGTFFKSFITELCKMRDQ